MNNNFKIIDIENDEKWQNLEKKYQKLSNKYSNAYKSGSYWYIGPSLIKYIKETPLITIFKTDYKLQFLLYILNDENNNI